MPTAPPASVTLAALLAPRRFGPGGRFELRAQERLLLVDGQAAALGARAFDLLLALVDQPGSLLSKRVLLDHVWPGLAVQENNLAAQVSALRKLLGADQIATIPGRGYCFTGRTDAAPPPMACAASRAATGASSRVSSPLAARIAKSVPSSAVSVAPMRAPWLPSTDAMVSASFDSTAERKP